MALHVLGTILQLEKLRIFLISPQPGIKTWKGGRKDGKTSLIRNQHRLLTAALGLSADAGNYSAWACHVLHGVSLWARELGPTISDAQECERGSVQQEQRTNGHLGPQQLSKLRKSPSWWPSLFQGPESCLSKVMRMGEDDAVGDFMFGAWWFYGLFVFLNPLKKHIDIHYQDISHKEQRFPPF